jgi:uncharacterized membrane-anchored protein
MTPADSTKRPAKATTSVKKTAQTSAPAHPYRTLVIILVYTALLLGGFLFYAVQPRFTGAQLELRLAPVDPTDLLAGEYMTLRYEISALDENLPRDAAFFAGERIYVRLSDDQVAEPLGYAHKPIEGRFIAGWVVERWDAQEIDYGIEQYYIPEGAGRNVWINGSWTASVAIDRSGNARIIELLREGSPVDFEYLPPEKR